MFWRFAFSTPLRKSRYAAPFIGGKFGHLSTHCGIFDAIRHFLITFFLRYSTIQKGCVEK